MPVALRCSMLSAAQHRMDMRHAQRTQRDRRVERVRPPDGRRTLDLLCGGARAQLQRRLDRRAAHVLGAPPLLLRRREVAPAVGRRPRNVGAGALVRVLWLRGRRAVRAEGIKCRAVLVSFGLRWRGKGSARQAAIQSTRAASQACHPACLPSLPPHLQVPRQVPLLHGRRADLRAGTHTPHFSHSQHPNSTLLAWRPGAGNQAATQSFCRGAANAPRAPLRP